MGVAIIEVTLLDQFVNGSLYEERAVNKPFKQSCFNHGVSLLST
jgi:hypothetical protein